MNEEHPIEPEEVIREKRKGQWYGTVTVKFEAGKPVLVEETKKRKAK